MHPERTMPANIRLCALYTTLAALCSSAVPALAHDRLDPADAEPVATAKLHNLVLYSDARLAFYGSETPKSGCPDRSGHNAEGEETSAARAEE
jgi:hypothetical protein